MAKWPIVGYDGTNRVEDDQIFAAFGGDYQSTTEANSQQEVRDTYTASNLRVYILVFDGGQEFRLRTNGADDTQVITTSGTGEFEDTTNTDNLVSGDLICLDEQETGSMHDDNFTLGSFQMTLDASSDVPLFLTALGFATFNAFHPITGAGRTSSTETDVEYTMRATRTLRDLRIFVSIYSTNGPVTVRKNQADGSLTVTITGTGEFLDSVNTDSFVAGDEANLSRGSGNFTFTVYSLEADTPSTIILTGITVAGIPVQFFLPGLFSSTTTEAEAEIEAEGLATIQNLFVNCFTYAETRTIRTRKNQANGNSSVSVSGTGLFEDTVNTDDLSAEDDLAIQQDAGSAGTNGYLVAVEWDGAQVEVVTQTEVYGSQQPVLALPRVRSY